jgi:hypothetical protein
MLNRQLALLPLAACRWHPHQLDRRHYMYIWQRLLSSGHRTADPAEADYFYVPVSGRQLGTYDRQVSSSVCWL